VDQRVAKKLLAENGAVTPADKRRINDGIEELTWVAALKPHTIGVPTFRDSLREYLEIAVLTLDLRPSAKSARLVELVHRAIPYPLLLVSAQEGSLALSAAHKRRSQNEASKVVLDDAVVVAEVPKNSDAGGSLPPLGLSSQPRNNLWALYQGWLECLEAIQAAKITGRTTLPSDVTAAAARRVALAEHERLVGHIAAIRSQADREAQVSRRVELNLELKRLEAALNKVRRQL
jgi:hypothetical protein